MKFVKKNLGQSLVEFGLSLPLVLFAIFLFLDLGQAIYYYSAVTNAVREGARYSIIHLNDADYETQMKSIVSNYSVAVEIDSDTIVHTPVDEDGDNKPDFIIISASYEFNPVTPMLEKILGLGDGDTITIHSSSSMMLAPIARVN